MKALLSVFLAQARYWQRHRLQAALALFGVALGVAVFTAIRMANAGVLAVFVEGLETFGGRATHRVFHPGGGAVPEHWFPPIAALPQVRSAAPVLAGGARTISPAPLALQVLGIDPLSEVQAGDFGFGEQGAPPDGETGLERFLRDPRAIAVPESLARELGLAAGGLLPVTLEGREVVLRVAAVFHPPPRNAELLARTVVMDVAAFQEQFSRFGALNEIRIVTDETGDAAVRAMLPPDLAVEPIGARAERAERMSRAFRLNLEALGLFALLVAVFLVHGTALFSVAQRERSIATMRCLGAPPRALFGALALETLCLGAAGGILGVAVGRWLSGIMVRGTSATLFEVILDIQPLPAEVRLDETVWAAGLGLGVLAAVSGTLMPALQGAWISPLAALRAWRGEHRLGRWMVLWSGGGVVLLCFSAVLLLSSRSILAALAGATGVALGGALLCPPVLWLAGRALSGPLHGLLGAPGLLAARSLARSLPRTGMSTVSLMITLSLALSVEITVHSFRRTFELWLSQVVTADLYVSTAEGRDAAFPQGLAQRLRVAPWVQDMAELKSRRVILAGREVLVVAVHPEVFARTASLPMLDAVPTGAMAALQQGGAFVSETLAYPLGLRAGDVIPIPGRRGPEAVPVAAVVQNYSVPTGLIYLEVNRFTALFGEVPTRQLGLWLRPGVDAGVVRDAIGRMPEGAALRITPNTALKREALRIFDRTFAITRFMSGLTFLVAFAAVAGALLALLEERTRVLGYLRAAGITVRALGASLALEAALLALVAGVMSWGVGLAMSAILVFAVNRRAFGWTLQFLPAQGSYSELLSLAVAAALLGSVYPIWRLTRLSVLAAIHEE